MKPTIESQDYWTHDLSPFIFKFPDSWVEFIKIDGIRYYGLSYLLGFFVAALLLRIYYKNGKSPLNPEQQSNYITAIILGVLLGGRMGYMLLYSFDSLIQNPFNLFKVWEGGMASHGGFAGVAFAIIWTGRNLKIPVWKLADITVTLAPAGIFFGRIANFINGELYGKITEVSWAIIFPKAPLEYIPEFGILARLPRHPSQLYAAFLEGLLLFLFAQFRLWKNRGITKSEAHGVLTGEFLIFYAVVRIVGEFFREPDSDLIFSISKGQFYSVILGTIGVGIISRMHFKNNRKNLSKEI